jgi:chromosome segregation ATPase
MSIRAEDAAREASRFSLRSLFVSEESTKSQRNTTAQLNASRAASEAVPAQHYRQLVNTGAVARVSAPRPATPPQVHPNVLTFGSLVGKPSSSPPFAALVGLNGTQAPPNTRAPVVLSPTASEAMRKLAELKKQSTETQFMHPVTQGGPRASLPLFNTQKRILGPGFVSGGSSNTDAGAEVMRLSVQIEELTQKVRIQDEKLHKTESSVVNANRTIEKERIESNSRLKSARSYIEDLKKTEAQLNKCCSELTSRLNQRTAAPMPISQSSEGFKKSAKRAETFDSKLNAANAQVEALTNEKKKLIEQVSNALEKSKDAQSKFESETAALQTRVDEVVASETAARELATAASAQLTNQDKEINELKQKLTEVEFLCGKEETETQQPLQTATNNDQLAELDGLKSQLGSAETALSEAVAARDCAQVQVKELTEELARAVDKTEVLNDTAFALEHEHTMKLTDAKDELLAAKTDLARANEELEIYKSTVNTTAKFKFEIIPDVHTVACDLICDEVEDAGETNETFDRACIADPDISCSIARRRMLAAACASNIERAQLNERVDDYELEFVETETGESQEAYKRVLKSVSMDITKACEQGRAEYLRLLGWDDAKIEEHINGFSE